MKKGVSLIFLTAIVSGFSIFINKFGVKFTNPYVFTFLKNGLVFLILFGIMFFLKELDMFKKIKKQDWKKLIAIGFIGGSVPFLLFFKGLSITTSAKAGFIHKTMFLYVAILAYFFLKERFNVKFFIATITVVVGNFLFLKLSWQPFNAGDLMIFIATIFWATENTLSKHVLIDIPSKVVAFSRMFFGSIFILIFLVATGNIKDLFVLNAPQIVWSIVPTAFLVLYLLFWYEGLKHVPATLATSILLLGSPITTLLNVIYAGAVLNLQQVVGMVMLVGGIVVFLYSVKEYEVKNVSVKSLS